jgi:pyruvate/2-oxoglutarate dehydrogenase complex dihydrolipoamide acyltransferase (E2) component
MPYKFVDLGPDRYLVWDLLRESDPYYLNHHLLDTDFSGVQAARDKARALGKDPPSFTAYALSAYAKTLREFPELNSYLRIWPTTKLAVYSGVDIALTMERRWNDKKIVLLALLKSAEHLNAEQINDFLNQRRDSPLESLEEFEGYKRLLKVPAFCRWHLFQVFIKPFPSLMRQLVGTTAFTSIGKFGTNITTPISPRTVTLSTGKIEPRPRSVNGRVESRLSGWMTVTYDHRVADGADIGRFANTVKQRIQEGAHEL